MFGLMQIFPSLITSFIHMCDLRQVRQYLKEETTILEANIFVSICLDYCNSFFRSLPGFNMCIFKMFTLVYKFLYSGYLSYFGSLLSIHLGRCGTRYNHHD